PPPPPPRPRRVSVPSAAAVPGTGGELPPLSRIAARVPLGRGHVPAPPRQVGGDRRRLTRHATERRAAPPTEKSSGARPLSRNRRAHWFALATAIARSRMPRSSYPARRRAP